MPKYRSVRRPKRKFSGNQHTKSPKVAKKDAEETRVLGDNKDASSSSRRSISSKKVSLEEEKESKSSDKHSEFETAFISGYRLIDLEILSEVFSSLRCSECSNFSITLIENRFQRNGCASNLKIFCESCGWKSDFFTSKKQTKSFEVNRRLIYSMRALGKGHSGPKKFCTLMNMPPPPTACAYSKNSKTINCQLLPLKLKISNQLLRMILLIVLCHVMAHGRKEGFRQRMAASLLFPWTMVKC